MEEPMTLQEESKQSTKQQKQKRKWWAKAIVGVVILLLLVLAGYLAWQLKICLDKDAQAAKDKQSLQSKVDDLTKQLTDAKQSNSSSQTSTSSSCSTQVVITQDLKDNLAAAISSKNTAALKGYMAAQVNVVFAASEKAGKESPDQAVTDLDYVNTNADGPWNFNLSAATLNSFKAGSYKQYFDGEIYVGESSNKYVVAYHFDMCGKIDQIFVSASADLLT